MAPEEKENLAKNKEIITPKEKKPISACKDFIHGINQLRADRSFSPWWCASLLLVSEAQTPGWNVSLCVQVERALCASVFPVCYPACQKNSGGDMRGKYSGELHPILFFFSVFISPRDVSSHLKGCVSQHCFSVLTSQLWGAKIAMGKKKLWKLSASGGCGARELQKFNMKKVILCALERIFRQRRVVAHHWLHRRRLIISKWAKVLCLLYTLTLFAVDHVVNLAFAGKYAQMDLQRYTALHHYFLFITCRNKLIRTDRCSCS